MEIAVLDTILDNRYRLLQPLGVGAGGTVYEAENIRTLHRVAIKVLHAHLLRHEGMLERFHAEAQAAGRIGSEQIVRVFDLGELPDGTAYLVMERLNGEDLTAWIGKVGVADPEQLAPIALQILDALVAAHGAGIIHRDVKPDNVFLTTARDGLLVKILDFGVSKFLLGEQNRLGETRPGVVVGSPVYMSPEQARGQRDVDGRTDIYSVGVMLFECVTARLPFEADTFNDLLFKIVLEDAPDPRSYRPELEPEFAALIHRAIARDRANRFQTAIEFRDALRDWMARHMGPAAESVGKRAHTATVVRNVVTSSGAIPRATLESAEPEASAPPAAAAVVAPAAMTAPAAMPTASRRSSGLLLALALLGIGAIAIAVALIVRAPTGNGTARVDDSNATSRVPSPTGPAAGGAVSTGANAPVPAALPASPALAPAATTTSAAAATTKAAAATALATNAAKTPMVPAAPKAPLAASPAPPSTAQTSTATAPASTNATASATAAPSPSAASASSATANTTPPPAAETRSEKIEGRAIRTEL